jgi:cold shock CspA family protein
MPRFVGRIKWFAESEGYGFIELTGSSDIFLHHTALEDDLRIELGGLVEFEIIQGPKGPMAERVTRPGNYPPASVIRNIDDSRFEREVLLSAAPVLVNFCATWCEECSLLPRILHKIGDEFAGTAIFNLDVDDALVSTQKYCIDVVPTIILFRQGREHERLKGFTRRDFNSGDFLCLLRKMLSDFSNQQPSAYRGTPPHEILNISASATREEIHAAFREMAKQYHPDKVATLAPEFKELAEKRMKEINSAYQTLIGQTVS